MSREMKLSKETIEFIDQICEDSVNHPVEFDNWPFDTLEERTKEDDNIAGIAQFITRSITDDECDPMLEILMAHQKMLERVVRILRALNDKVENLERHCKNLDKRVYAEEEKHPGKKKLPYKQYT